LARAELGFGMISARQLSKSTFAFEMHLAFFLMLPGNVTTPFPSGVRTLFASGNKKSSSDWL